MQNHKLGIALCISGFIEPLTLHLALDVCLLTIPSQHAKPTPKCRT